MFELGFIDLIRYQKTSSKTFTSHNQPYENQDQYALNICGRLICSTANNNKEKAGNKQHVQTRRRKVVREEKVLPPSALLK